MLARERIDHLQPHQVFILAGCRDCQILLQRSWMLPMSGWFFYTPKKEASGESKRSKLTAGGKRAEQVRPKHSSGVVM